MSIHPTNIISDAAIGLIVRTCWSLWYEKEKILFRIVQAKSSGFHSNAIQCNLTNMLFDCKLSLPLACLINERVCSVRRRLIASTTLVPQFFLTKSRYSSLQSKITSSVQPLAFMYVLVYFTCIRKFQARDDKFISAKCTRKIYKNFIYH